MHQKMIQQRTSKNPDDEWKSQDRSTADNHYYYYYKLQKSAEINLILC